MNLFSKVKEWLESFKPGDGTPELAVTERQVDENLWEKIPYYIDVNGTDKELVSVIAASIAAGDAPESEFRVKSVQQRNPEAVEIALIASSIAAREYEDSHWVVHNIYKKK